MPLLHKVDYLELERHRRIRNNILGGAAITAITLVNIDQPKGKLTGSKVLPRERKSVDAIFSGLGRRNVRKSYRMHVESFHKLHKLLFKTDEVKKQRGAPPNGHILKSSRLSMALRWFAGGDKMDIAPHHGVGFDEVMRSVWEVVEAVNSCDELQMKFPCLGSRLFLEF